MRVEVNIGTRPFAARCRTASLALAALAACCGAPSARAYEARPPRYIDVELAWKAAPAGAPQTAKGQLWFSDLPVRGPRGDVIGFGKLGYYTGVKWFVPRNPGEIWIQRAAGSTNAYEFLLHDHFGERNIVLAFDRIDVTRTDDAQLTRIMDTRVDDLDFQGPPASEDGAVSLMDGPREVPVPNTRMPSPLATPAAGERGAAPAERPAPLRLATAKDIGVKRIAVADLVKVTFLTASDGLKRETYGGRYVAYSNQARGDEGRVQVAAATFFGGADGEERFMFGDFASDGSILLAGNFHDLSFVDASLVRVIGADPAADAYPAVPRTDPKSGRQWIEQPRRTVSIVRCSADLGKVAGIVRLAWGVGQASSVLRGPDDALYVSGWPGPHFDAFTGSVARAQTIENPEAVAEAQKRGRVPGGDGFVLKIAPDHRSVAWAVRSRHAGLSIFLRPDGNVLARRGNKLFFIDPGGAVIPGPELEIAGSKMAVDPASGALYFGGSYRSGTGLEPYVCPYLYKVDAAGKHVWTAYGWTGPIVGVAQHRLVSDSSVTSVRVGPDGNLTLTAWSDGGNTVLTCQPYDLRKSAPCGGFASEVWGATGGLTIRIGYIIRMNAETMEVDHYTRYVGYIPTCDVPTLVNIYDMLPLPDGQTALTGGGHLGFIETHDAWLKPWYIEHQTNEFAQAKGGPFFTVFTSDFSRPRISTITPGASGLHMAGRDRWVLLYGGATDLKETDTSRPWDRKFRTIIRNAIQPVNGGGLDGYAVLVDTRGEPRPPAIPPKTWGQPDKRGAGR